MIGMIDEDAPEKAKGQQSVEVRGAGVLVGAGEGDERDVGYLDGTDTSHSGAAGPCRSDAGC